ncbi:hypothetical protein HY030_04490, partial [Candidatus Gottesmanbacteria bacterium]|nr:hypothetical protein [Candidatus Gottesmanbacteria bacterium]
ISAAFGVGIILAAIGTLIYLLWGAFEWITSGGDKTNLENARNKIVHAIIGLVIVAAIWVLFGLVQNFLGIKITGDKKSVLSGTGSSTSAPLGNQGNTSGGSGGPDYNLFRCPGPNCDRCPGGTRAVDKNDPRWLINNGCP